MPDPAYSLDELTNAVQNNKKYARLSPTLINRIASEERSKHKDLKTALKSTRTRLHRLTGAFLQDNTDYAQWLNKFKAIPINDTESHKTAALQMMRAHASTRERLPFLENFFNTTLSSIAPVHSVLDLACGLNPLAIDFMPLSASVSYQACDVVEPMIDFLQNWFTLQNSNGSAFVCDLLSEIPKKPTQVTFVLKTLPILDQVDPAFSSRLLDQIPSEHILISYPSKSLGGRSKGMEQTYTSHFDQLTNSRMFRIQRFDFPNEIAFLLSR
jgi:16S rRNA (guanine(1405)-N(7))-methyltransferase